MFHRLLILLLLLTSGSSFAATDLYISKQTIDLNSSSPDLINPQKITLKRSQTFEYSVFVKNQGTDDIDDARMRGESFINTEKKYNTNKGFRIGTEYEYDLLGNNQEEEQLVGLDTRSPDVAGIYYLYTCVSDHFENFEENFNNNCSDFIELEITNDLSVPDYKITDFQIDNNLFETTESILASFTFTNVGTERPTYEPYIEYFLKKDTSIVTQADSFVESEDIAKRGPGFTGEGTDYIRLKNIAGLQAGTYYVSACIVRVEDELNLDNNCSDSIMVTITGEPLVSVRYDVIDHGRLSHCQADIAGKPETCEKRFILGSQQSSRAVPDDGYHINWWVVKDGDEVITDCLFLGKVDCPFTVGTNTTIAVNFEKSYSIPTIVSTSYTTVGGKKGDNFSFYAELSGGLQADWFAYINYGAGEKIMSCSGNVCSLENKQIFSEGNQSFYIKIRDGNKILASKTGQFLVESNKINGQCGDADGHTFAYNNSGYTSTRNQCDVGTPSTSGFPSVGSSQNWTCSGINGGSQSTCSASRGTEPVVVLDKPVFKNASFTSSTVYEGNNFNVWSYWQKGTNTPFIVDVKLRYRKQGTSVWTEKSMNYDGGSSSSPEFFSALSINTHGLYEFQFRANVSETASGTGEASVWSSARTFEIHEKLNPVNGQCGDANTHTFTHDDTSYTSTRNQCDVGNPSTTSFPSVGSSQNWTCSGIDGGSQSTCSASRSTEPVVVLDKPIFHSATFPTSTTYVGDIFTVRSAWSRGSNTPEIVDSKFRYRKQGVSSWSSGLNLDFDGWESSTATFIKGLSLSEAGIYEFQFRASVSESVSSTGEASAWITSDKTFEIHDKLNPVNGECGDANGHTFSHNDLGYSSTYKQCNQGSPSTTNFPLAGASQSWTCSGTHGGSSSSCSASKAEEPIQSIPTITSVTPLTVRKGDAQVFTIVGSNLPSEIVANIDGSQEHCSFVSLVSNGIKLRCIAEVTGNKRFYLKDSNSVSIKGSQSIYINVTESNSQTLDLSSIQSPLLKSDWIDKPSISNKDWVSRQHVNDVNKNFNPCNGGSYQNLGFYCGITVNTVPAYDNYGWDFNVGTGDDDLGISVRAVADSYIDTAGGWVGSTEGQLLLRHESNGVIWYSGYLHMTNKSTKKGLIKKGEIIGYIGSVSSKTISPHLHFIIYKKNGNKLTSFDAEILRWEMDNSLPRETIKLINQPSNNNFNQGETFNIGVEGFSDYGVKAISVNIQAFEGITAIDGFYQSADTQGNKIEQSSFSIDTSSLAAGRYEAILHVSDREGANGGLVTAKYDFYVVADSPPTIEVITSLSNQSIKVDTPEAVLVFKVSDPNKDLKELVVDFDKLSSRVGDTVTIDLSGKGSEAEIQVPFTYPASYLTGCPNLAPDTNPDILEGSCWRNHLRWKATVIDKNDNSNSIKLSQPDQSIHIYDYDKLPAHNAYLTAKIKEQDLQKSIEDKTSQLETVEEDFIKYCANKIYEKNFSNEERLGDKRRTTKGVDIYEDIGDEDTIVTYGSFVGNNYEINVNYDYLKIRPENNIQSHYNYPALVSIYFDIAGQPTYNGERRQLSKKVYNYIDKELAISFLAQKMYTSFIDSDCGFDALAHDAETNVLEKYESSLSELTNKIDSLSTREINERRVILGDVFVDLALDIADGTEPEIAKEIIFDSFSTLELEERVQLMFSANPFDKLIFDFLEGRDYLSEEETNRTYAGYQLFKFQVDPSYVPDVAYIEEMFDLLFEREINKLVELLVSLVETISPIGIDDAHGISPASFKKAQKILTKKVSFKVSKILSKASRISAKTRSAALNGIRKHKEWKDNRLYGSNFEAEFPIKFPASIGNPKDFFKYSVKQTQKSFRLDGIKFDKTNKKIILRELKPNNPRAIRKGELQLENSKRLFDYYIDNQIMIPNSGIMNLSGFKVIISKIDIYK